MRSTNWSVVGSGRSVLFQRMEEGHLERHRKSRGQRGVAVEVVGRAEGGVVGLLDAHPGIGAGRSLENDSDHACSP